MSDIRSFAGRTSEAAATHVPGPEPNAQPRAATRRDQRLPVAFWRAWLVLVVVVALEFTIVYWGASLIDLRTGAGVAQATTAAAAFLLGMIVVRAALSAGIGARAPRRQLSIGALIAVVAGALIAWQATAVPLAAAGLFLAGLGVGPLCPVGITFALGLVRHAAETAAARASLATGVALIGAPYLLALAGERVGLVNAWPLVAVAALVGIGLVTATGRDTAAS